MRILFCSAAEKKSLSMSFTIGTLRKTGQPAPHKNRLEHVAGNADLPHPVCLHLLHIFIWRERRSWRNVLWLRPKIMKGSIFHEPRNRTQRSAENHSADGRSGT